MFRRDSRQQMALERYCRIIRRYDATWEKLDEAQIKAIRAELDDVYRTMVGLVRLSAHETIVDAMQRTYPELRRAS